MRTIFKYKLDPKDPFVELPQGAIVRHVDSQGDNIYLWAEVETTAPKETRAFRVYGTGHLLPTALNIIYLGSLKMYEDRLIFHVYEVLRK